MYVLIPFPKQLLEPVWKLKYQLSDEEKKLRTIKDKIAEYEKEQMRVRNNLSAVQEKEKRGRYR